MSRKGFPMRVPEASKRLPPANGELHRRPWLARAAMRAAGHTSVGSTVVQQQSTATAATGIVQQRLHVTGKRPV